MDKVKKQRLRALYKSVQKECVFFTTDANYNQGMQTNNLRKTMVNDSMKEVLHPLNSLIHQRKTSQVFVPFINERNGMGNLILQPEKANQTFASKMSAFHKVQDSKISLLSLEAFDEKSSKGVRPKYESRLCSILGIERPLNSHEIHQHHHSQSQNTTLNVDKFTKKGKSLVSSIHSNNQTIILPEIDVQKQKLKQKDFIKAKQYPEHSQKTDYELIVQQLSKNKTNHALRLFKSYSIIHKFNKRNKFFNHKLSFNDDILYMYVFEEMKELQKLVLQNKSSSQRRKTIIVELTFMRRFRLSYLLLIPAIDALSQIIMQ